jgi:organic radical activating enzyme
MKNDLVFKAVIDNNPKKHGLEFHGLPIISYEEAKKQLPEIKIVISQNLPTEVRSFLLAEGFIENRDFFTLHDFIPRFYWSKDKTLAIKSVDFAVTTLCNMNCKGCQTHMPIAVNRRNIMAENIIDDLNMLFTHVDSVMGLNICCGESMLNKETAGICADINRKFASHYHTLMVQTNGTIIPNDDVLRCFAQADVVLVISNYPENEKNTSKIIEKCNVFNTKWYINSAGNSRASWYDLGDPRIINEENPEKLRKRYSECWQPGMGLYDGKLYICAAQTWSHLVAEAGMPERGDAFDLRQPKTEASREELFEILTRQPPKAGYVSQCKRCYGVMNSF